MQSIKCEASCWYDRRFNRIGIGIEGAYVFVTEKSNRTAYRALAQALRDAGVPHPGYITWGYNHSKKPAG